MTLPARVALTVRVVANDGYEVVVDDGSDVEYARVFAGSIDRALTMAVPYIACVCVEPDPLADFPREAA